MFETWIAVAAIITGISSAVVVAIAVGRAHETSGSRESRRGDAVSLTSGILKEIALLGGAGEEEAASIVADKCGGRTAPAERADLASWGASFRELASEESTSALLEAAVEVAMATSDRFPPAQYDGLVTLSFALGFHSDALARLREKHQFEYDDWAHAGRPREADRSGGGAPLIDRRPPDLESFFGVLGLTADADRQDVISAYRRLAAESHPDHFHDATPAERDRAAQRFRDLTSAYERLLGVWNRD